MLSQLSCGSYLYIVCFIYSGIVTYHQTFKYMEKTIERMRLSTSQQSEFTMTQISPNEINFTVGQPGSDLIPKQMLDKAISSIVSGNKVGG